MKSQKALLNGYIVSDKVKKNYLPNTFLSFNLFYKLLSVKDLVDSSVLLRITIICFLFVNFIDSHWNKTVKVSYNIIKFHQDIQS